MYPFISIASLRIPTYGLMMAVALFVSSSLCIIRGRKQKLQWETLIVIIACIFGFAIIGAVLLYFAVTYSAKEIIEYIKAGSLFTEHIGFVFYGGLIAGFVGAYIGFKLTGADFIQYTPVIIPYIPIAHAIGRVGCFLGGCCYGIPTNLPIGVIYPEFAISEVPKGIPLFPVQLLESGLLLGIAVILLKAAERKKGPKHMIGLYMVLYSCCRFGLEFLRYDAIRGSFQGLSTSQWISVALLAGGILLLFRPEKTQEENVA